MSDTKPQYGEKVHATLPNTTIINNPEKNEHDLLLAREATKRSVIRTTGTVLVFAVLFTPIIITLLRAAPQ